MASDVVKSIFDNIKKNKINSAYLVVCDRQKALSHFATDFLLMLYCEHQEKCGLCSGCKKVLSENMADILLIHPQKNVIKVDDIRAINDFLAKKAYEGFYKTVVIYEADKMNINAQNALLKPLEQPPAKTTFILLTRSEKSMLPTIISRCQNIRILPDGENEVMQVLDEYSLALDIKRLIVNLSYGYVQEAKVIADDKEYFEIRSQTIANLSKFLDQNNYAISYFVDFIEKYKHRFDDILNIIKSIYMDILKYGAAKQKRVIFNCDQYDLIEQKSRIFTTAGICNMMDKLLDFESRNEYNINFRLNIESMLFCMLEEKYRWLK